MKQPMVRVRGGDGLVYYPRFEQNTDGAWKLKDASFQEMIDRQFDSEKPAKKDED
jgi:phage pi2 protein 07